MYGGFCQTRPADEVREMRIILATLVDRGDEVRASLYESVGDDTMTAFRIEQVWS